MEIQIEEIWKDIPNYEGLYQASNLGNIKALEKIRATGRNRTTIRTYPEKIIKPSNCSKTKYFTVTLCKYGKIECSTVHKLIALTFLEKKHTDQCVNHIDCNRLNNKLHNLEWCTLSHNSTEAFLSGRQTNAFKKGKLNKGSIKVLNKSNGIIYNTILDAYLDWGEKSNMRLNTFYKKIKIKSLENFKLV
jgi:hypothetical protein